MEALHDVESDEQASFRLGCGGDSEKNDGASDVDYGRSDHRQTGLFRLCSDPSGLSDPLQERSKLNSP